MQQREAVALSGCVIRVNCPITADLKRGLCRNDLQAAS
jgi:hypothetical protein